MSSLSIMSRFSSSAFYVLVSRVVAFVALFGFNAVLARSLTPAEFGIFALLFSFATLASLLGSFGMNRALVKVLADGTAGDRSSVGRVINIALVSSTVGGLIVGLIGYFLVYNLLPISFSGSKTAIAALFAAIVATRNIHFVLAETARGFHETTWSNLMGGAAGGPATHLLFLIGLAIAWFASGNNSLSLTLSIYLACFIMTLPPLVMKIYKLAANDERSVAEADSIESAPHDRPFSNRTIWLLAIPLMLTQTFGLTLSQADIWLAGAMVLPASIAIYCAAQRMMGFLTIPLQISGTAIVSFIPDLIAKRKLEKLQEMMGLATFVSGVPGIVIGSLLILFPETVLSITFGPYYAQAAPILQILVIGQLICVLTGPCELLLMMAGHQNKTLTVNVVAAVAIFTLGPLGIYAYGITGLAIAICSITACQNILNWWLAQKLIGISTHFNPRYAPQIVSQLQTQVLSRMGKANATT